MTLIISTDHDQYLTISVIRRPHKAMFNFSGSQDILNYHWPWPTIWPMTSPSCENSPNRQSWPCSSWSRNARNAINGWFLSKVSDTDNSFLLQEQLLLRKMLFVLTQHDKRNQSDLHVYGIFQYSRSHMQLMSCNVWNLFLAEKTEQRKWSI